MLSKSSPSNNVKNLWFEENENDDQEEEQTKCLLLYDNDSYRVEKICEIDLTLCSFLAEHLRQVKLLNSSSLPVSYDERFYADYLNFYKIQQNSNTKSILLIFNLNNMYLYIFRYFIYSRETLLLDKIGIL